MVQGGETLRDQVLVRREVVVGQRLPVRQQMHAQFGVKERNLFHQPLRFQRVGGNHYQRRVQRSVLRQGQRVGRTLEVGVARAGVFRREQH